ncbi:MAG: ECF-type sigma factor [Acidobacteriaceae bacterium]
MDAARSQSAELAESIAASAAAPAGGAPPISPAASADAPEALVEELSSQAQAGPTGLSQAEFAEVLLAIGVKHNFGLPGEAPANAAQKEAFWRGLHLRDVALAHACARGKEPAWQHFLDLYRSPLKQAAAAMTRSLSAGEDLADSLYSELFGLTEREGARWSPLASYSGRGSLMGWLRATLAQRLVDRHRATHRETPLEGDDRAAEPALIQPSPETLAQLSGALTTILRALPAEDRFLLSSCFLDGHTLLELAGVLRVHEATISRRVRRLTKTLHKQLLKHLESRGLSRRAAQEALGTDPRDLNINLRNLLQSSHSSPFSDQAADTGRESS